MITGSVVRISAYSAWPTVIAVGAKRAAESASCFMTGDVLGTISSVIARAVTEEGGPPGVWLRARIAAQVIVSSAWSAVCAVVAKHAPIAPPEALRLGTRSSVLTFAIVAVRAQVGALLRSLAPKASCDPPPVGNTFSRYSWGDRRGVLICAPLVRIAHEPIGLCDRCDTPIIFHAHRQGLNTNAASGVGARGIAVALAFIGKHPVHASIAAVHIRIAGGNSREESQHQRQRCDALLLR